MVYRIEVVVRGNAIDVRSVERCKHSPRPIVLASQLTGYGVCSRIKPPFEEKSEKSCFFYEIDNIISKKQACRPWLSEALMFIAAGAHTPPIACWYVRRGFFL